MSASPCPVIRVGLLGAECTGKSTLAAALNRQTGAILVPEYLREFCDERFRTPKRDEQWQVLHEQIRREEQALELARHTGVGIVVCDSTPLATALYSLEIFGDDSLMAPALAHQSGYDLTLVTATDMPWQRDGIQRDGQAARDRFDARLQSTLTNQRISHLRLTGSVERRLRSALEALAAVPGEASPA